MIDDDVLSIREVPRWCWSLVTWLQTAATWNLPPPDIAKSCECITNYPVLYQSLQRDGLSETRCLAQSADWLLRQFNGALLRWSPAHYRRDSAKVRTSSIQISNAPRHKKREQPLSSNIIDFTSSQHSRSDAITNLSPPAALQGTRFPPFSRSRLCKDLAHSRSSPFSPRLPPLAICNKSFLRFSHARLAPTFPRPPPPLSMAPFTTTALALTESASATRAAHLSRRALLRAAGRRLLPSTWSCSTSSYAD